jgi:hypothetical protein
MRRPVVVLALAKQLRRARHAGMCAGRSAMSDHCAGQISEWRTPFQATALKRMSILTGEVHYLRGLGLRRLSGKGPASARPFMVGLEHDAHGIVVLEFEHLLQHAHHELHWSMIVVQKPNLEHR